jgi:MFS family permease
LQRSIIAPAERVTNLRWTMLALIAAVAFVLSYGSNGIVIGIWGDGTDDWHQFDRISAALATLVAAVPAGVLIDRFGVRRTGFAAGVVWVLGMLGLLIGGATALPASIAIGVALATAFPLVAKMTASWFPRHERSRATAIGIVATNLPLVLGLTLPTRIVNPFPYRPGEHPDGTWLVLTAIGLLLSLLVLWRYRDADDSRVTYAERTFIDGGGAQPVAVPALGAAFTAIVRSRSVWAMAFAFGAFSYAFVADVPATLSIIEPALAALGGAAAAITTGILALAINVLVGGVLVDALARGAADARIRRIVLGVGSLCLCGVLGASGAGHAGALALLGAAIVVIGSFAAQPVAWTIPGFIAPRGAVGTVAAIMTLAGTLGAIAGTMGDPPGAAIAALIAALIDAFALGRIEPIVDPV